MYTRERFKKEMVQNIQLNGYDPIQVAKFSYQLYMDNMQNFDVGLREIVLDVINMDMGPEFEMTEEEFKKFLDDL